MGNAPTAAYGACQQTPPAAASSGAIERNLVRLAEQGDPHAQFQLGEQYYSKMSVGESEESGRYLDNKMALKWYRRAANQGHPQAQCHLAWMYFSGVGVPQDLEKASRLYMLAAENGFALAQNIMGTMYMLGQGVKPDVGEAIRFYKLSALQGFYGGQNNLGWLYHCGVGVPRDYGEAVRLFRLAAAQGNETAETNLGWELQNGNGVEMNLGEAIRLYRRAAAKRDKTAQFLLGWLFLNGYGVISPSVLESKMWLEMSGVDAAYGVIHQFGLQGPPDYELALRRYSIAATALNETSFVAKYCIGYLYDKGLGVEKNRSEARRWYELSAEMGFNDARLKISSCNA